MFLAFNSTISIMESGTKEMFILADCMKKKEIKLMCFSFRLACWILATSIDILGVSISLIHFRTSGLKIFADVYRASISCAICFAKVVSTLLFIASRNQLTA